jgi:mycothiol synthase
LWRGEVRYHPTNLVAIQQLDPAYSMPPPLSDPFNIALPGDFHARPGVLDDLEEVTALFNRADRDIIGVDSHRSSFYRMIWTRPGFDLERDTRLVVTDTGELVGAAYVDSIEPHVTQRFLGHVLPEHRGRGIGSHLVRWCEARCRERVELAPSGTRVLLHTWLHTGHSPSEALFAERGLKKIRHFIKMGMPLNSPPEEAVFPEGLELRPVDRTIHDRAICAAEEESFRDHWGFFETPFEIRYENWKHNFDTDPLTDESLWFVAWDGDEIAGFLICTERSDDDPEMGYMMDMGVRPAWRRRGLATAFLRHGFRAFWDRGIRKAGLHADGENLTGAVRIYRKVGMEIVHVYDDWELELRAGKEMRVVG